MPVGTLPIIRLEVEGMKHAIVVALSEYAAKMDADVKAAVERACEPARIVATIETAADKAIEEAIKEEIQTFFKYGSGRKAIKDAVEKQLTERQKIW